MSAPLGSQPPALPPRQSELRRRRDRLAEEVAELQWALGGLAYEMAIRDHFRLDVLLRRAATLQQRDAELAETERLLHMQESAVAGSCLTCGAVHSRGAVYCWQCGAAMMERSPIVSETVTAELGAAVGGEDRVPLPPVPAPRVLSSDALDGDRQNTLVDELRPGGAAPTGSVRQDALGQPVTIRR